MQCTVTKEKLNYITMIRVNVSKEALALFPCKEIEMSKVMCGII